MDAYDEPFDEFIGPSTAAKRKMLQSQRQMAPLTQNEHTPIAVVSPEPSPVASSSSRSSTGPPSSAFAPASTNLSSERWTQYERDGARLRQESELATGRAVYSAAERVANRTTPTGASPSGAAVQDRMNDVGISLPHPDELKSYKTAGGFSFSSARRSQRASEEQIVYQSHDRVRAEALKVLEMADDVSSPIRKTSTGGYTTEVEQSKRLPARVKGISFTNKNSNSNSRSFSSQSSHASNSNQRYTIDDVESDDDMVDVVNMQNTVGRTISDSSQKSSWSSRYSVSQSLLDFTMGGYKDSKAFLDSMDTQEQQRMEKSARNMFRTSPHKSKDSPKIFGNVISFATKNVFGRKETEDPKNVNLQTAWMDVDLQSNGRSLPLPPLLRKQRGPLSAEQAKRRRRICLGLLAVIVLVVIIAASVAGTRPKGGASIPALEDPNAIKFYVTADVPYDTNQEDKIIRDVESIPSDADFLMHIGNIQDASVTMCPQQAYKSARAILRRSAVPVFTLPGPNDWTNCPKPDVALKDWRTFVGHFERLFIHSFGVTHQLGNEENFGFLTKGVLFIGIHLVGGRRQDKEEWRLRHAQNVRWVTEQLAQVPREDYRALVILANARPSQQHDDFFSEIMDDVNALGKPALYIHANAGTNVFEQYAPFQDAPNLIAVQIPSGGSSAPLRVAVGEGPSPFGFDI